jgi:hypothetical protein
VTKKVVGNVAFSLRRFTVYNDIKDGVKEIKSQIRVHHQSSIISSMADKLEVDSVWKILVRQQLVWSICFLTNGIFYN